MSAGVPGSLAESAGPSASSASLSLLAYVLSSGISGECGAKGALRSCARRGCEPPGDERRGVDEFATSAVLWPKLGQELIQVGCDQAGSLVQSSLRRRHNEGHSQHGVREVLGGERDDEVAELPVGVLLCVCIGQR